MNIFTEYIICMDQLWSCAIYLRAVWWHCMGVSLFYAHEDDPAQYNGTAALPGIRWYWAVTYEKSNNHELFVPNTTI